jgi:hypothetical protein
MNKMNEIDKELATTVMGWKYIQLESKPYIDEDEETGEEVEMWYHFNPFYSRTNMGNLSADIWTPSTKINQAMEVVKELLKQDLFVEICLSKDDKPEVEISYGLNHPKYPKGRCYDPRDERIAFVEADTLEMAICLAALKVVKKGGCNYDEKTNC